jgi:hypothetical protein
MFWREFRGGHLLMVSANSANCVVSTRAGGALLHAGAPVAFLWRLQTLQLKLGHFHQPVGKCAADTCSLVPSDSAIESQGVAGKGGNAIVAPRGEEVGSMGAMPPRDGGIGVHTRFVQKLSLTYYTHN